MNLLIMVGTVMMDTSWQVESLTDGTRYYRCRRS